MKLAIVGITGLVGSEILKVIDELNFPFDELLLVASEKSVNKKISFKEKTYKILSIEDAISKKPNIAIFSAGSSISLMYAPKFAAVGTTVIDNSSAWRIDKDKKLIVPSINANTLTKQDKIIANPNCSTIQLVIALSKLHEAYRLKRVVISTYQSVTGTGKKAVEQLMGERKNIPHEKVYPYNIDLNVLPHIDAFFENGYTKEEMKMVNETKKIFNDEHIQVTATAVRIPTIGGHSEAVNVEFYDEFDINHVLEILKKTPSVILQDDVQNNLYPMPILSHGKNEVFVGRVRRDETQPKTLNMWIVGDNLRIGAATNALQIAKYTVEHQLI